jgi:beta-glucuronidase
MHLLNFGELPNQPLDCGWGILPDPMDRCRRQKWWRSVRKENYWFPSYDDDAFWPTTVPGAFTRIHPELAYYEGTVVYLNHFVSTPVASGEKVFLHFEGISERADVFLNGFYLGRIQTGFVPATFDVTGELAENNRLMVLVENQRRPGDVPGVIHDWWQDGGIVRPVRLYRRPSRALVREASVETRLAGDQVELTFRVMLDAAHRDEALPVEFRLLDPATGQFILECHHSCVPCAWQDQRLTVKSDLLRLWSCDDPFLYELHVSVGEDRWSDTVGLREIRTRGRDLLLNGSPVILRGVNTLMDDPVRGAITTSDETALKLVDLLRQLHCNFVRAHRPLSREFIRACDRAGILVWQEVPAYWLPTMAEPVESRHALETLAGMVRDFRNSPSVIIWSIGNECLSNNRETGPSNLAYFLEAADYLHREDPSRLVTYTGGLEGNHDLNFMETVFPRQIADKVDVISFNSYAGIDEGASPEEKDHFDRQYDIAKFASSYGKPVIHAEAGIDSVLGEKSFDYGEDRGAAYQRNLQRYFAKGAAEGWLQGMAIFVLSDYRSPIKLNRHQRGYNRKGLLTEKLEPKAAFDVVREGYAEVEKACGCSRTQGVPEASGE